jgi:hypothetical protein
MKKCLWAAIVSLCVCSAALGATGRITGKLTPAGRAVRVGAVERIPATLKKLLDKTHWGRLNEERSHYVIEDLKPGTYDLAVETKDGRIEGVQLEVRGESDQAVYDLEVGTGTLTTERFDISQYIEPGQVLADEQRDELIRKKLRIDKLLERVEKLKKVSRFMDELTPLWVHGTRERAVVLMDLRRVRQFYAGKSGEAIWRVETWPFRWMYGVWHKPRKGLRVWQRQRLKADAWGDFGYVFDPRLGGIEVERGEETTFDISVPETLPAHLGKVKE